MLKLANVIFSVKGEDIGMTQVEKRQERALVSLLIGLFLATCAILAHQPVLVITACGIGPSIVLVGGEELLDQVCSRLSRSSS